MEIKEALNKVFMWMAIGLIITFAVGYYVSLNPNMVFNIFGSMYWVFALVQIILVWVLAARTHKMSYMTAAIMFIAYSFLSGLTFSFIFVVYEMGSIIFIFGLTALMFGLFAFLGNVTKIDLSKFSTIFFMGLLAIIIVSIINYFIGSEPLAYIISWICIALFLGITAYDIQKIKRLATVLDSNKVGIIGALDLYLDFINIFISLMRLFGKRR